VGFGEPLSGCDWGTPLSFTAFPKKNEKIKEASKWISELNARNAKANMKYLKNILEKKLTV